MHVTVCVKHAPRRVVVDPLTAAITVDPHDVGLSAADEAALEMGLRMGDTVTVVSAGPIDADASLRAAAAVGADRVVRCPGAVDAASLAVADALATVARPTDLVLCGDYSADRGSGSVPAFIAAQLGWAQALGVVTIEVDDGRLIVERRLDRGRRERLGLAGPAVVSLEGAVARLRRAPLTGVVEARGADIELGPPVESGGAEAALRPHRPRVQARPGPDPTAAPIERLRIVTDATTDRSPPRVITAEPAEAARAIVEQLKTWGYLDGSARLDGSAPHR